MSSAAAEARLQCYLSAIWQQMNLFLRGEYRFMKVANELGQISMALHLPDCVGFASVKPVVIDVSLQLGADTLGEKFAFPLWMCLQ